MDNQKWTIQRNWQHRVHKTKKNIPEKLATQGTQDEEKHSRETGNIEYTRRRKTIQRNWQHRVHKTKKNIPEKLATQGTQDEEKHSRETGNIEEEK